MRFTGKVVRVSKQGKIKIPSNLFKKINFNSKQDQLIMYQQGENVVIKKKEPVCYVTGKASNQLTELLPGIYVSQEGMEQILREIKDNFD